jgi:hypothetical protein
MEHVPRGTRGIEQRPIKVKGGGQECPPHMELLCGGDSPDQVFLFLSAFSADGEGV